MKIVYHCCTLKYICVDIFEVTALFRQHEYGMVAQGDADLSTLAVCSTVRSSEAASHLKPCAVHCCITYATSLKILRKHTFFFCKDLTNYWAVSSSRNFP